MNRGYVALQDILLLIYIASTDSVRDMSLLVRERACSLEMLGSTFGLVEATLT